MDNTPAGSVVRDLLNMDHSILNTPKPQASSTVNRRVHESLPNLPPELSKGESGSDVSSPGYLSNAIDGVRLLNDQLGSLRVKPDRFFKMPGNFHIRKAASVAELCEDRRGSVAADSEANSSLGIIKLDDWLGFSEPEDGATNISNLLADFRKEHSFQPMLEKENIQPDSLSGKRSLSGVSFNEVDNVFSSRQPGIDISSKVLNMESDNPQSRILKADLNLRLQKALAQQTINKSMDSSRLSQTSDNFISGNLSFGDAAQTHNTNSSQNASSACFSNTEHIPSPASNATFGAANFMSFSGSPAAFDSSENFQPADMAMDRLKHDENSWRQHFEDLPVIQDFNKEPMCPDDNAVEHLTQNLDFSNMSGISAGEISVSSSIMGDIGKRRLSVGEYFKLHSEQLGGRSEDKRPNYFDMIKSPSKSRPHPPLVNTGDVSIDEIPTRDSCLNKSLNYSFPDTLSFSISMKSDMSAVKPEEKIASRSIDLMPPPPPRPRLPPSTAGSCASESRDSISARLSMSLSLPRPSIESAMKDLNSSSVSLDSGEKFVSISQMMQIMQNLPSGKKSARELVDDFMQRCRISQPESKTQTQQKAIESSCNESFISRGEINVPFQKAILSDASEHSPSRDQRVKDWISNIHNSGEESNFRSDMESVEKVEDPLSSSNSNQKKGVHDIWMNYERSKLADVKKEKEYVSEHNESGASSFMPPPYKSENPTSNFPRNFSTPKIQGRQSASVAPTGLKASSGTVAPSLRRSASASQICSKTNLSRKLSDLESQCASHDLSYERGQKSQASDNQSSKESYDKTTYSKHSSQSSSSTLKSLGQKSNSYHSDGGPRTQSVDWKYCVSGESRPQSNCGSTRSAASCAKSSSKQTDGGSGPLQIDSTHTQLSWASVSPGASVTQTFALRNKSAARVRLLVSSPNAAFKLIGERGEILSELVLTLHTEETRRIHVTFSPISTGAVVGKLVISRVLTSETSSVTSEDRRLIGLYGYGGKAELAVEGASKDRWAQLFLNMCLSDSDMRSEVSDIDISNDAPQMVSSFLVRNSGKVPAYISLQIAGELPFVDCGVYVAPKEVCLVPGEVGRILVRFEPGRDILQWLNKNADDMQLLANIWLSWSELATWQRLRRLYLKYYNEETSGPLSTWGTLYSGDIGVGHKLKDNRSSESSLAQAVRRLKVAVLIEREKLNLFDMDATMVFDMLIANETAMFNSPQFNDKALDSSECFDSPILSGAVTGPVQRNDSPISSVSRQSSAKQANNIRQNDLVVVTSVSSPEPQVLPLEFPPTIIRHKSKVKITFENPSSEKSFVSISDLSPPFSVPTPKFYIPSGSYVNLCVLFRPFETGTHHSTLNILVNGNVVRSYLLQGEGVHE